MTARKHIMPPSLAEPLRTDYGCCDKHGATENDGLPREASSQQTPKRMVLHCHQNHLQGHWIDKSADKPKRPFMQSVTLNRQRVWPRADGDRLLLSPSLFVKLLVPSFGTVPTRPPRMRPSTPRLLTLPAKAKDSASCRLGMFKVDLTGISPVHQ